MLSPTDIYVAINGRVFIGWTSVEVTQDIAALCSTFRVGIAPSRGVEDDFYQGAPVELGIGKQPILTGYIDKTSEEVTSSSHSLVVEGRDKAGDLVDCDVYELPTEYKGISYGDICAKICDQFGLGLKTTAELDAVPEIYKFEPSATAADTLSKIGRRVGVYFRSTPDGSIRAVSENQLVENATLLEEGVNIGSIKRTLNQSRLFSRYIVICQAFGKGAWGKGKKFNIVRTAVDEEVKRYRPKVFASAGAENSKEAEDFAAWQRCQGRSSGYRVSISKVGWMDSDGKPWVPGELVRVRSPKLRLDRKLLIGRVLLKFNINSGTTASIELIEPDALAKGSL